MTRTILIIVLFAVLLTACSDPLGIVAREQIESQTAIETARISADAAVQTARIDASTARVRVGGWMVVASLALLAVVAVAVIAGATKIKLNQDNLLAEHARTLPPVTRATPLPAGRPVSRRPVLMRPHTLALPMPAERDADIIVIDS